MYTLVLTLIHSMKKDPFSGELRTWDQNAWADGMKVVGGAEHMSFGNCESQAHAIELSRRLANPAWFSQRLLATRYASKYPLFSGLMT